MGNSLIQTVICQCEHILNNEFISNEKSKLTTHILPHAL